MNDRSLLEEPEFGEAGLENSFANPPLIAFRADVDAHDTNISDEAWEAVARECSEAFIERRNEVPSEPKSKGFMFFVTHGICAGQLAQPDGRLVVSRFFEAGDICTTIESAQMGQRTQNSIVAVTNVEGVSIPMEVWNSAHFEGGVLATYTREKMYRQHLFEIDLLHTKTENRTEVSYEFLKKWHPAVLAEAPQTVIAQFCGITPEGLSRFLKNYSRR
ncbi:MAG: hypothetical protein AAF127_00610 [Pseudomonadota bacterium]